MKNTDDALLDIARAVGVYEERTPRTIPAPYREGYEKGRRDTQDRLVSAGITCACVALLLLLISMWMLASDQHMANVIDQAPPPSPEIVGLR